MSLLIHSFYEKITRIADGIPKYELPIVTTQLLPDHAYTPFSSDWIGTGCLSDVLNHDGGYAYRYLFRELIDDMNSNETRFICDSDEIGEDPIHGEFNYEVGFINKEIPYLLASPPFPFVAIPTYLTIYGPEYQIEVKSDHAEIEILRVNHSVRGALMLPPMERKAKMLRILRNSDRPRLDIPQQTLMSAGVKFA